jgi:hypothetical protein
MSSRKDKIRALEDRVSKLEAQVEDLRHVTNDSALKAVGLVPGSTRSRSEWCAGTEGACDVCGTHLVSRQYHDAPGITVLACLACDERGASDVVITHPDGSTTRRPEFESINYVDETGASKRLPVWNK